MAIVESFLKQWQLVLLKQRGLDAGECGAMKRDGGGKDRKESFGNLARRGLGRHIW